MRFSGIIGGPHHDAGVILTVRGWGKWRLEREEQRTGRDEQRSRRDEQRTGCGRMSGGWGVEQVAIGAGREDE